MRPLLLSFGMSVLVLGAVWAQTSGENESGPQLPVGQTFKQFEYPIYQDGKLKATLSAATATGITLNRAETTDLKIASYENGTVATTITSPKADLYVAEQKMRTKNTVEIDRADMNATSQNCDFDLKTKKYVMRTNVRVLLKHFDVSMNSGKSTPPVTGAAASIMPVASPAAPRPPHHDDQSMLDSPGAYADTNSAPVAPGPDVK
jgi:hypothetical protein